MILLAALGVCASLAMNLLVQFGLGLGILAAEDADATGSDPQGESILMGTLLLFVSLFLLWLFFSYILAPLRMAGFYWYLLLYPLSAALMKGLELLYRRFLPRIKILGKIPRFPRGYTEFLPLGLLISLHLALHPLEALFLALCFSLGVLLSLETLREIRRRSRLEAAPSFLRGLPLSLISLGILSLIFSSASLMFFNLFRLIKLV